MIFINFWTFRYKILGNLPHVLNQPSYLRANGGFSFDYQLINVPDFNGTGESSPSPFFYQNIGEAEYVVATFMYMRLLGYPAERISILTTYNGQKHLLRDVVNARYLRYYSVLNDVIIQYSEINIFGADNVSCFADVRIIHSLAGQVK